MSAGKKRAAKKRPAKRKAAPVAKRGRGRPSSFKTEYLEQAKKLIALGARKVDLADFFGVSDVTIDNWCAAHSEFLGALKEAKDEADERVEKSLFRRALGYSHPAVKIIAVANGNNQGSTIEEVPYIERYAPDTTACIFWLKNRQPGKWRDKQEMEHSGKLGLEALIIESMKAE